MSDIFQPQNLDEAVDYLLSQISSDEKSIDFLEEFENDEDGFICELHHFTGMNMRNDWYLWWHKDHGYKLWPQEKPAIVKFFNDLDIYHADDMSSIILHSTYRKYYNLPLELDKQVSYYHNYWLEQCGNINPMKR